VARSSVQRALKQGGEFDGASRHPRRDEAAAMYARGIDEPEIARAMGITTAIARRMIDLALSRGEIGVGPTEDDDGDEPDEPGDATRVDPVRARWACARHLEDLRREHGPRSAFEIAIPPGARDPLITPRGIDGGSYSSPGALCAEVA
jgi:hypothetical protein